VIVAIVFGFVENFMIIFSSFQFHFLLSEKHKQ